MIELALIAWFPLTILLFISLRPHIAATISLVGGVAVLPSLRAIELPILPNLDQYTVPLYASFLMVAVRYPQRLVAARPGRGGEALVIAMCVGAVITNVTNTDAQIFGANILPGMRPTDIINDIFELAIFWGLPFLLGRMLIRSTSEAIDVLVVLALAGLIYVPFIMFELYAGPFFHAKIYGAAPAPSTFSQNMKFGGYRPVVLMNHGLTLSSFMFYVTVAWVALSKIRHMPFRVIPPAPIVGGMTLIVGLCKSVGVWLYAAAVIPVLYAVRPKAQLFAAICLSATILTYPFLRSLDMIPIEAVAEVTQEFVGLRSANSFMARIESEDEIIDRTAERYLFGWGEGGRSMIYDPVTGRSTSIVDGLWLIQFGIGGMFRFVTLFSFLLFPVFYAYQRLGKISNSTTRQILCALVWIVAIRTFDLLPNSTIDPYLTFLGGTICGLVKGEAKSEARAARAKTRAPGRIKTSSTRRGTTGSQGEPESGVPENRSASLAAHLRNEQARGEPRDT
jgi:hypothetical protein